MTTSKKVEVVPRLRILRGREIALGPGKADLLDAVERTGSIAQAARDLGMSYTRAWKLVRTMNACFTEPLVESVRGGAARGGARLTEAGLRALEIYRTMERASRIVTARDAAKLRRMMR